MTRYVKKANAWTVSKNTSTSRRENTRVFGIPEDEDETPLSILKETLLSYFEIADPIKKGPPGILCVHIELVPPTMLKTKCAFIRDVRPFVQRASE